MPTICYIVSLAHVLLSAVTYEISQGKPAVAQEYEAAWISTSREVWAFPWLGGNDFYAAIADFSIESALVMSPCS
jgi:hypothetical protein